MSRNATLPLVVVAETSFNEDIDQDDGEPWSRVVNMIDIMEKLLPYCDTSILKSCRLVCSLWNDLSLPIIRSRLSLTSPGTEDFRKLIENSPTLPVSKINVVFNNSNLSPEDTKLLSTFGPDIHHLNLSPSVGCRINTGRIPFINLLDQILVNCPNLEHLSLDQTVCFNLQLPPGPDPKLGSHLKLKSLSISLQQYYPGSGDIHIPFLIKERFFITPSLEKIHIHFHQFGFRSGDTFIKFLELLRDSRVCRKLTEFSVSTVELDPKILELLSKIAFPKLRVLRVDNVQLDFDQTVLELFTTFLQNVSPTLEKLFVRANTSRSQLRDGFLIELPKMPKLISFENGNVKGFPLGNVSFLEEFPNLRVLTLRDELSTLSQLNATPGQTLWGSLFDVSWYFGDELSDFNHGLKRLKMDAIFVPHLSNVVAMKRMMGYFPKLEELETAISLSLNNVNLPEVMQILAAGGIRVLKIVFVQSGALMFPLAFKNFVEAIGTHIPEFKDLKRLELSFMEVEDEVPLPFKLLKKILLPTELKSLTIVGFTLEIGQVTKCKELLSSKLIYWKVGDFSSE